MGESPEGRQMKPDGFPTFSKTSQGSPLTLAARQMAGASSGL